MASIAEFWGSFNTSASVRIYSWALKGFEASVGQELEPWLNSSSQDDIEKKITDYYLAQIKPLAPRSRMVQISAIRQVLLWFKKDPGFLKILVGRNPGFYTLTIDQVPDQQMLYAMFKLWSPTWQAYYAVLACTGCRGREILRLPKTDIDLSQDPAKLILRSTKTGMPRVIFLNSQAKELLQEHITKTPASSCIFNYYTSAPIEQWWRALRILDKDARDPRTSRRIYHPHTLRKRFRTILGTKLPRDIMEALMGHDGYLDASYRRYSTEELAAYYQKVGDALKIE